MLEKLKQEVYEANMQLPKLGLVSFTWGNVSGIDREKGLYVIKPSGVPYDELKPEDMVVVNLKGEVVEGDMNPSSDTPTHTYLYNHFPKIGGIVHTHSPWAVSFAAANMDVPALNTTHADTFYTDVPAADALTKEEIEEDYEGNTGKTIVRTFNHEEDEEAKFAQKNEKYYHSAWLAQFFSILIFPFMNCIKNVGYLLVAVIGAVQIIHGQITLGNVQAFLQYTNQFSQPLTQVANLSSTIQQTIASAERIFEVLDAPEMDERILKDQPLPGHDQPKIEFKDVQFSYNDEPLIQDFNLKAPTNHMVAIVGPTGAGKSTIINLLERFYDVKGGHIYLDGHDTRTMTRSQLRTHIAMVLQDTWLFKGTIFDNIKYGREDATEEEVYQAARLAYADSFIRELPAGYQTVLDESASNISQGQRQLLTIARAFLANPEILILDEATSSVDTRTESLIQNAMNDIQQNRTSFVVAHRLSTIRNAEQIIVMNHGRIIETGNHQTLMAKQGFYADLYNSQFLGNQI